MQVSVRGFLFARFVAMVAWALLLLAGYLTYRALAPHLATDVQRWSANLVSLAAAIWLGYAIQARVLRWLDPEGELRREVREQSAAARRLP